MSRHKFGTVEWEKRKFYKYLVARNAYNPSIRISGVYHGYDVQVLGKTEVFSNEFKGHAGGWSVDGYFRCAINKRDFMEIGDFGVNGIPSLFRPSWYRRNFESTILNPAYCKTREMLESISLNSGAEQRRKERIEHDRLAGERRKENMREYTAKAKKYNDARRSKKDACMLMTAIQACQELLQSQNTQPTNK